MSKRKSKPMPVRSREPFPKLPGGQKEQPVQTTSSAQATRETIESIVIAFILAFLFRTFEAEAFVIPTGSMAPTLQGRHKDVDCPECGYRFRVGASEEEDADTRQRAYQLRNNIRELEKDIEYLRQRPRNEDQINAKLNEIRNLESQIRYQDVLTGECPICRYNMVLSDDLPPGLESLGGVEAIVEAPSYSGDRILVNKYIYSFTDPKRWDVVVFKFPGNAQMNYIKRLVGLPGEVLRIYQGDLFSGDKNAADEADFAIARKPPDKVLTMRQPVHDTNYEPADLYEAGWPLRWQPTATDGWDVQAGVQGKLVHQHFISQPTDDQVAWLRYRHTIPSFDDWLQVEQQNNGEAGSLGDLARPHLISDFNPYNARIKLFDTTRGSTLEIPPEREGLHWVGDLMLEAEVDIKKPQGNLLLDLVEGGRHFTARIDLATGRASLSIDGLPDFKPEADTGLIGPGSYRVALANVDDQLMLWVDRRLVKFSEPTIYNADELYGGRQNNVPQTSSDDPGDLAPAGIGTQNAEVAISRLRLWRDIYYIADNWKRDPRLVTDLPDLLNGQLDYLSDPNDWGIFAARRSEDFPLSDDQYFVMGDNSPESLDARLWKGQTQAPRGIPGGAYLERRLLIGKALCVYWPHAWYYIPGTPVPVWPNFTDVRLVR
jgi:signal peptidase I